jgi:hypothetical protein
MSELLLKAAVGREILSRMGFTGVNEYEGKPFFSKLPCYGFQRWRRQRTVRSG